MRNKFFFKKGPKKEKRPKKETGRIRRFIGKLLSPMVKLFYYTRERARESIRFELIITFGLSFVFALIVYGISSNYFSKDERVAVIDYSSGINEINGMTNYVLRQLNEGETQSTDTEAINEILRRYGFLNSDFKLMITDLDGNIIYKTSNVSETQIDVYNLIKNASNFQDFNDYTRDNSQYGRKEVVIFYPLKLKDIRTYLITKAIPEPRIQYQTAYTRNDFLALIIAVAAFILSFIFITNKKMRYIEEISYGVSEIAKGNLNYRIESKGKDELNELVSNINYMAREIKNKMENERRSEKTKSELITNVSHDLRTPLTSVMGYIGLVKDNKFQDEAQKNEFLNIAFNKAEKLKVLIEDLFEYTKLTNEGVKLYLTQVNLNEFIEQLTDEMMPICESNDITVIKDICQEKLMVSVDPSKMFRVLDNLISNAIKYSFKPGEVKVSLKREGTKAFIAIENRGENIPQEKMEKLFERFYRVDESRSNSGESSGLGLAISKNIVELHGGEIWANCFGNIISFNVSLNVNNE